MIVVEQVGVLRLHLHNRIAVLLRRQEITRTVTARRQNLVLDTANCADLTVSINRAGTRNVAAVRVASGILIGEQGTLAQLIDRAQRQHQTRARAAHTVQVVLHVRRQVIALLQTRAQNPAAIVAGTNRGQLKGLLLAVTFHGHVNRRTVRGVYRLRNIGEGLNLLLPHLQNAVISLQSARRRGALRRGKHLNLLGHRHLQLAHRRDLRLSLRISHLRAGRRRRLLMAHVRVQGIGRHHEAAVTVKRQPAVERLRAGQLRVRATRNRHRGHVHLAVRLIAGRARDLNDVLILVGSEHVKERAGALLHIGAGQNKSTSQQGARRHSADRTQVHAARRKTRTALSRLLSTLHARGGGVRLLLSIGGGLSHGFYSTG